MARARLRQAMRRKLMRGLGVDPLAPILRDDFITPASAPLTSPRSAEPGPGTLTITDTENKLSISGGNLVVAGGKASPVYGDPGLVGSSVSRLNGRTLITALTLPASNKHLRLGFRGLNEGDGQVFHFSDTGTLNLRDPVTLNIGSYTNTTYQVAVVLRAAGGGFYFIKGGSFTNWTLLWFEPTETTSSLVPAVMGYDSAPSLDTFRVLDLPSPFTDDYGIATQRLAGARTAGDTFTHTADCVIEWTQTTVPSVGEGTRILFRRQDDNNCWYVVVNSSGALTLIERVAGTDTSRGSAAGVVANGDRIVVVADGSTIRVYEANTLRITYASATNFATATNGKRNDTIGTEGGAVSDIVAWPRKITGVAENILNRAVL